LPLRTGCAAAAWPEDCLCPPLAGGALCCALILRVQQLLWRPGGLQEQDHLGPLLLLHCC
jgi:hypothetical protein